MFGMGKVVVIMGVCGSGKTTVGKALAARTGGTFIEGDSFHPEANVEKMRSGQPLTDDDRQGWLESLGEEIGEHASNEAAPCFVGCSALKASYRDILREGAPNLQIVWLTGSRDVLAQRMNERRGHFMPAGLLDSQLATLEAPHRAIVVGVDQTPRTIVDSVLEQLNLGDFL